MFTHTISHAITYGERLIHKKKWRPYIFWLTFIPLILSSNFPSIDESLTQNRVIYLFALSKNEPRLVQQLKFLGENLEGQAERDLVVTPTIFVMDKSREKDKTENASIEKHSIAYPFINIRNPFCLILVGKDGTEKLRSYEPLPIKKIFSLIDQMPMRLEEIKAAAKP